MGVQRLPDSIEQFIQINKLSLMSGFGDADSTLTAEFAKFQGFVIPITTVSVGIS